MQEADYVQYYDTTFKHEPDIITFLAHIDTKNGKNKIYCQDINNNAT